MTTPSRDPAWLVSGAPHVWRPYCQHQTAPAPFAVAGAHGARLVLEGGGELVDGIASWWTSAHGYNHPHIAARVETQLRRLSHVAFGGLANEPAYTLAERLAGMLAPLSKVFFVESGSVSVEVALKMAVQSFHNRGDGRRRKIVCFENAYHGDTLATMALSDPVSGMHHAFAGMGIDAIHLPVPRSDDGGAFEDAFRAVAAEVAGVVIEPLVQCAGGMRFHDGAALQRLRKACDEHGAWLIFDEIATGFYRTGSRFAFEAAGVVPDIVTLGKALTGGTLPLAAVVATSAVFECFLSDKADRALQHGPTYMGNALACAAAHGSLDLFEREDFKLRVSNLESKFRERLAPLRARPNVVDVRALGAIGVVEMKPGTAPASTDFAARGVFLRPLRLPHADVVYVMPSLAIEASDLDHLLDAIDQVLPS
ncbi:adenosylmethionine--8-amino-7-oxononanoate transaminase [Labilithrix luteola]|nr:adenosylmethionine--8-amino-7-oxononanoate transaminase [Labilithrix luteola]